MKHNKILAGALFGISFHIIGIFFFDFLADIVKFITPDKYHNAMNSNLYGAIFFFEVYSILLGVIAFISLYLYKRIFGLKDIRQYFYGILLVTIFIPAIYLLLLGYAFSSSFFLL